MGLYIFIFICSILSLGTSRPASPDGRYYPFCRGCRHFAIALTEAIRSNQTFITIRPVLINACEDVLSAAHFRGHVICPGLVDLYAPPSLYILSQAYFAPDELCEKLEFCPTTYRQENGILERNSIKLVNDRHDLVRKREFGVDSDARVSVDSDARVSVDSDARVSVDSDARVSAQLAPIRILQLTDIHLDHRYQEGAATDCGMIICCREGVDGSGRAGKYGDYSCDLPVATLESLTHHLRHLDPQPDFVIYTGDTPTHDIWNKTLGEQIGSTHFLVDFLSANLPGLTIYPTMGNHETFPDNLYYSLKDGKFTAEIATLWQHWVKLPDDAVMTIRSGGYYTMLIRPGLRLMSINTEFGYQFNFYTLLNKQTPQYFEQQRWMDSTLSEAARNGEKVLIIGHVPPGQITSVESFGDFYVPLVAQYKDVIVGQIFGHSHEDQFQVVHSDGHPSGVIHIAPSVTPYPHINPSYRVYLIDPETFKIIDYQQYHINLAEANNLAKRNQTDWIKWQLAYTAMSEYDLPDLTAESWWKLIERFQQDDHLFTKYRRNTLAQSCTHKSCFTLPKPFVICSAQSASKKQLLNCLFNGYL